MIFFKRWSPSLGWSTSSPASLSSLIGLLRRPLSMAATDASNRCSMWVYSLLRTLTFIFAKTEEIFLLAFLGLVPSDDGLPHPLIDNGRHLGQHGSHHGVGNHKSVRYLFPLRHMILYTFPFLSGAARRSQSRWWSSLASSCSASARSAWCSSWRGWPSCPPSPPSSPPTHWPWSTAAFSLSSLSTLTHNSEKILSVGYLIVRHKFIKSYC